MNPQTFDNAEVFLSEASQARATTHEQRGSLGSSLASIRTDLKSFSSGAPICSQGLSLQPRDGSCKEQYVFRLRQHTVKVIITSYKPGENMGLLMRKSDSANQINQMLASMQAHIEDDYKNDLTSLVSKLFKHNADSCMFSADSYEDDWSLVFHDPKNRTQASVDIYRSEDVKPTVAASSKSRSKAAKTRPEAVAA